LILLFNTLFSYICIYRVLSKIVMTVFGYVRLFQEMLFAYCFFYFAALRVAHCHHHRRASCTPAANQATKPAVKSSKPATKPTTQWLELLH